MTDRELLELAAKAAGIVGMTYDHLVSVWNPLTDDGDRYRLARATKLIIVFDRFEVRFQMPGEAFMRVFHWEEGNQQDEAFAIVRAAAEIGRSLSADR